MAADVIRVLEYIAVKNVCQRKNTVVMLIQWSALRGRVHAPRAAAAPKE